MVEAVGLVDQFTDRPTSIALTQQDVFARIQTLRALLLQGLVGDKEPETFHWLASRLIEDVAPYAQFDQQLAALRTRLMRIPTISDPGQRQTLATQVLNELNRTLVEGFDAGIADTKSRTLPSFSMTSGQHLRLAFAGSLAALLLAGRLLYGPLVIEGIIFPHHNARIASLERITEALQKYRDEKGGYPLSAGNGASWSGVGRQENGGADWLSGLVPDFLDKVPVDPRDGGNPYRQFVYKSNGNDYKLLALMPEDCPYTIERRPELSDPMRNVFHQCRAYGFWTPGATKW